jgi:hypothetical protein
MRYYTPSIPAMECPPLVPDNTPVLVCPSCGDTMKHLRTIPKLGARLEQFIFVCPSCEQFDYKRRS